MISLATIIISFNTRDLLAQTLRSFYEAVAGWGELYHVIVVDNASSDESAAMVARWFVPRLPRFRALGAWWLSPQAAITHWPYAMTVLCGVGGITVLASWEMVR